MVLVNFYLNFLTGLDIFPIIDILKYKSISNVININCNHQESILWHKLYNDHNIKASFDTSQAFWKNNASHNKYEGVPYSHIKIGVVLNTSCGNWSQAIDSFPVISAFKTMYVWLIFSEDLESTANILSNYSLEIDSDVNVILKKNGTYTLYELFHTYYSFGKLYVRQTGYWNGNLHFAKMAKRDLSGLTMKCIVIITNKVVNETFQHHISNMENQVDTMHKFKFFQLINYIRDMYNISYELQRTNSWGYVRGGGQFDGVVGALERHEADVGGSPLFFRGDRAQVIDYVAETWRSRQCFILRHPKHPGGFYTIYTRPLAAKVWYCILCMLGLSAVILRLMWKVRFSRSVVDRPDSSFSLALLFIWSAICQQGMIVDGSTISIKVVVLVTFLYSVTLYQYYNATVVATLLREPPKYIRTLDDLVRSNLKAGAENALYAKDFFKHTTDEVAQKMYHKKIVSDHQYNFYTVERGMALVKQGGFAFHVESTVAYKIMSTTFTEREICEAHEVPLYPPQKMGLVLRKSSPYKEYFTFGVRKALESGLMQRLRRVWDEPRPACVHTPDSSVFAVTIREFATALIALAAGMIASVLILLGEMVAGRTMKRRVVFRH